MLDFKVLNRIRKEAIASIKSDSDGDLIQGKCNNFVFGLLFWIIPIGAAIVPWILNVKLSYLAGYITTGISIFTGLFFSLLLNISSKIRVEQENTNKDISNFKAFKENMRQISNITLYIIIVGISIMLMILSNSVLNFECCAIEISFTSITLFWLVRYFVCLFFMLQRFFFVLRDEVENIL